MGNTRTAYPPDFPRQMVELVPAGARRWRWRTSSNRRRRRSGPPPTIGSVVLNERRTARGEHCNAAKCDFHHTSAVRSRLQLIAAAFDGAR
jgi:hypothetical protein